MSEDLEANESTLLVESSNAAAGASPASLDSGAETSTTTSSSSLDDIKDELNKPWPATFDRGIQILAGPILDEKDIDKYTKSPGVRARYKSTVSFHSSISGEMRRLWNLPLYLGCDMDAKIRILGGDMARLSLRRLQRCTLQARRRG